MKNGWYQLYGYLEHYTNNQIHNVKNAAIISEQGDKFWLQNDERYRLDGPAMEYSDGDKYWFYQGEIINCQSQQEFERLIKLKLFW